MSVPGTSESEAFLRLLRDRGVDVGDDAGTPTVAPRHPDGPSTTIDLPEDLLVAHLDRVGRSYAPFDDDPRAAARGLLAVQLADDLTADHGGGVNRIRRVALVPGDEGPQWLEERTDDPGPSAAPTGVAHDDPHAFASELDALAQFLRGQGLDAVAEPEAATVHVRTTGGRSGADVVALDLRPERYRRWFDEQEAEYEAIGGDPREHAWRHWCRLVLHVLTGTPDTPRRLSFVESPDGEVAFVPDAEGDEPPAARREWSAERGS